MNRNALSCWLVFPLFLALAGGCASGPVSSGSGRIRHIVIVWLKPGADRAAVLDATRELGKIPGVVDYSAGTMLASDRKTVDSSYDLAIILTFDSETSLRAYDQHPIHKRVIEEVVKPNVARFLIYDSTVELYDHGEHTSTATRDRRAAALEATKTMRRN